MLQQTKWELVIEFMNENKGMVKSRKQLLDWMDVNRNFPINRKGYTTIDCYKNYLLQANLIKKIPKYNVTDPDPSKYVRGKFFIPHEGIPENLSVGDVRSMAYGMIGEIIPDDNLPRFGFSEIRDRWYSKPSFNRQELTDTMTILPVGTSAFSYSVDKWDWHWRDKSISNKKKKVKTKADEFIKPEKME